ncbi:MAG: Fmu (Sun) protein [Segetibacter sp.]|nr:Fmu (Sun) protein [Segetibacter sp.]
MSRFHSHINTAKKIIETYKGEPPLAAFLKNFFAAEKKYGGKDRKNISSLCYSYYRLGKAVLNLSSEDRMLTGLFLAEEKPNDILAAIKPEWNELIANDLSKKLEAVPSIKVGEIFPFTHEVSAGVDPVSFAQSFLNKPKLFIRIRPGKKALVVKKLNDAGVAFEEVNETCIAFTNATRLEDILLLHKEYVVQDLNSQNAGAFIEMATVVKNPGTRVWDCCAASGGKSIMAADLIPELHLTVSDVRRSIIHNLEQRFKDAAIKNYNSFVTDLTAPPASIPNAPFDLVICDAPCSGSGTWSRTPEQLFFFTKDKINHYADLQKRIALNAVKQVKKGGHFLYITCSVFKKENEDIVEALLNQSSLQLVKQELLAGYDKRADSMFAALFKAG